MSEEPIFILLVAGARPNFMKLAPIARELEKHQSDFRYQIVHTGQHYDSEMSDVFFEELGIRSPDIHLGIGGHTHAEQTARIMVEFERVCFDAKPELIIVMGDVNSTLACSITAKKLGIRVGHVEAGLRSRDMSMPEEINRIVTDSISDYFFVTEESGVQNLLHEGKAPERIFLVGHVMVDNLLYQINRLANMTENGLISNDLKKSFTRYAVMTLHRPSNVDTPENLGSIMTIIGEVGEKLPVIFPVHPRTRKNLEEWHITVKDSIVLTEPLSYMNFLNLWKDAAVVLTDSGGIQEETTAIGVPCLTLRENTERPITVSQGTNVLVGCSRERIHSEIEKVLRGQGKRGGVPKLWDGNSSARIVRIIKEELD